MSSCYVMTQKLTPKGILIDTRMRAQGKPGLLEYVTARRGESAAWRTIAAEVEELADLRVTETGLRYWLDKAAEPAEAAS